MKHDGVIAELYAFVPPDFHSHLNTSQFFATKVCVIAFLGNFCTHTSQFLSGGKAMRSYIISNIRRSTTEIFPVVAESKVYAKNFNCSQIPEIMDLLRNPKKPGEAYPRYPSILYKDGVIMGNNLFRSSAIFNVS